MIKVQKLSKDMVKGMIRRGEVKKVLTYGDITKIQEFMELEVGFDANIFY